MEQFRQGIGVPHVLFTRVTGHAFHPVQVRACGEIFAVGAQNHQLTIFVPADFVQDVAQFRNKILVKGIVFIRTVQGNRGYAPMIGATGDICVCHVICYVISGV